MTAFEKTTLSARERALLERLLPGLADRFGERLRGVWLYGSRARGEPPSHEDSDVDLLVLLDEYLSEDQDAVHEVMRAAERAIDDERIANWFSVHVHDVAWLAGRREIKSFYIAEVDRDKIVLHGDEAL